VLRKIVIDLGLKAPEFSLRVFSQKNPQAIDLNISSFLPNDINADSIGSLIGISMFNNDLDCFNYYFAKKDEVNEGWLIGCAKFANKVKADQITEKLRQHESQELKKWFEDNGTVSLSNCALPQQGGF
jgi:hypothetical protein